MRPDRASKFLGAALSAAVLASGAPVGDDHSASLPDSSVSSPIVPEFRTSLASRRSIDTRPSFDEIDTGSNLKREAHWEETAPAPVVVCQNGAEVVAKPKSKEKRSILPDGGRNTKMNIRPTK